MKILVALAVVSVIAVNALSRSKRQAYELPAGASLILTGNLDTKFTCNNLNDGYYADISNNCEVFHVCHTDVHLDGTFETRQWSFFCGNQTIFNQLTLTCAYPEDSTSCKDAAKHFPLNNRLFSDDPKIPFLTDDDVASAQL